ncbi:ACT domain-containing protein ACR2-like isoform X2 [Phalaenopsis equestris]|nr:ACT domain-containing protein ACR2-like isoform X2 [Phalaenopsis equestris]
MMDVCYPYFDPDFENLNERIYGPRVNVDNEDCKNCTVVKVDSLEKQGPLLEVLQVLIDMDLLISKSYIFSDAGWFMDVIHVKDKLGNKIRDNRVINYIQQAIYQRGGLKNPQDHVMNSYETTAKSEFCHKCTVIEIIGINRPGLFSEILAVLAEENCNVIEAHAWSHNDCLACVAYVSDQSTSSYIDDPNRLSTIKDHLSIVLQANSADDNDHVFIKTCFTESIRSMCQTERRLHQLMLANRDFDGPPHCCSNTLVSSMRRRKEKKVTIDRCTEKGYLIANIECIDRPKLMFDTVCTLTDMNYIIFHASITSDDHFAFQEYYIRHEDGYIEDTDEERQVVSKCLEAAVNRRECEGLRLELCAQNSVGLLPYVTRTFREHGLTVARADIEAHGEKTSNVFYVKDISGNEVDMETVDTLRRELDPLLFQVKTELKPQKLYSTEKIGFSFTNLLRSQLEKFTHSFVSP